MKSPRAAHPGSADDERCQQVVVAAVKYDPIILSTQPLPRHVSASNAFARAEGFSHQRRTAPND